MKNEFNTESLQALTRLPAGTDAEIDSLTAAITGWTTALEAVKWPRALQWFENVSYLQGNHLTRFYYTSDTGFGVNQYSSQGSKDNLVAKQADNRLIRPVETVVGMLTQNDPMPRVEPNSDLPEDEDAAALAEIVLQLLWEKPLEMPRKIEEAGMITAIAGTAAIEIEYGPTDTPVIVPKMGVVSQPDPLDPEGEDIEMPTQVGEEVVMRNDIIARVWTPYHLLPDPSATGSHDLTWIARSSFEDREWVAENYTGAREDGFLFSDYDELLDAVKQDNATKFSLYWWSKFQDIIESPQSYQHGAGMTPQSFQTAGGAAPNQTMLYVIDVRPSRQFPRGRTLVVSGTTLIYEGDARAWSEAYPWRWHPYAFMHWFKIPGKFWGVPLLSELVPLQKRINAIDAQVHANRQYLAIGQWLIPKHSKMREGGPSGIPGENFTYTAAGGMQGPERVRNAPLPPELLQERDQLLQAIDYIAASGSTDAQVSKSAARAGVMLDFLRQEKLRGKAPMLQGFERCLEVVAQNILIEIQLNLRDEDPDLTQRIRAAAREYSSQTIGGFTGSSLRDHHSVAIDIASALMHSPEAKEAKAMEAFQYGQGQLSPHEREGIFRAIGLDEFTRNAENASVKRARRMISWIANGNLEAGFPMPGVDVVSAMAPVFQDTILSDRFIDMAPEAQQLILALGDEYAQLAAEEAQQQMQQQIMLAQAMKGGGQQQGE